jgi:hypothetical protein
MYLVWCSEDGDSSIDLGAESTSVKYDTCVEFGAVRIRTIQPGAERMRTAV